MWRSGTTLLREVLGMSDEVKIFPEHFALLHHLKEAPLFSEDFKSTLFKNVSSNPDFIHFAKPDLNQLKKDLAKSNNFESAIKSIYNTCLTKGESINTFIDKNPIYSYYLPELLELFPKAKFIWMLREPKDNCISRAKHDIQSFKNYSYLATWWNLTNQKIQDAAKIHPERFLLVPYDLMVEEPKPWVKKICNFLDITYHDDLLTFDRKKEERLTDFVLAVKARDGEISTEYAERKKAMWENLQKPINSSKTKQWKVDLSESEIDSIDSISKEYYSNLLKGNFNFSPKKHVIHYRLAQISLFKLKSDIRFKRIT